MTLLQLIAKATELGRTITFTPDPASRYFKIEVRDFFGDRRDWARVASDVIRHTSDPRYAEGYIVEQLATMMKIETKTAPSDRSHQGPDCFYAASSSRSSTT